MSVAVIARFPDLTPETYGHVIAALELDVNPPAGAIFHMAAEGVGGVVACEIWQTEQTFRAFLDYRLRPQLRMYGIHRDPIVEISALHNVYAPELFTIERMGAVSLPAHLAGAAL